MDNLNFNVKISTICNEKKVKTKQTENLNIKRGSNASSKGLRLKTSATTTQKMSSVFVFLYVVGVVVAVAVVVGENMTEIIRGDGDERTKQKAKQVTSSIQFLTGKS